MNVETRPFARIARRLLSTESLVYTHPTAYPTPPPDGSAVDEEAAAVAAQREKQAAERQQWREEMLLDFAALEDSMVRIQLLRRSNEAERERYAAEKLKILDTAQLIRENTTELRAQLDEAQRTLARRKTYDELADKITANRMLKPRSDQRAAIEKLNAEIAELEQESGAYAQTWAERREQFGRIVEEGKQMLRLIRDEKEEAERKEGMEEADEAEGSRAGTPTPASGGATPAPPADPESSSTPLRPLPKDLLAPNPTSGKNSRSSSPNRRNESTSDAAASGASPHSGSVSRGQSPSQAGSLQGTKEGEDTEMGEVDESARETETGEVEEGEESEVAPNEQMDTT